MSHATPMSRAELLDTAAITHPHLRPLVLAASDHRVCLITVPQRAGRFDSPPAGRPFVLIVGDDLFETLGPAAFHSKSLRRVLARASHVGINAADTGSPIYPNAAGIAAGGGNVVIIECRPETERAWLAFVRRRAPAAAVFISTPNAASYPPGAAGAWARRPAETEMPKATDAPWLAARIAMLTERGHAHLLWAVPGDQPPAEVLAGPVLTASFLIDAGCASDALNDPALTVYLDQRVPLVFACEREDDRRTIVGRRATFTARGYHLWTSTGTGRA